MDISLWCKAGQSGPCCWRLDSVIHQAPVVQKLDSGIQRINHYPVDKYEGNQLHYPPDSAIHLLNNWGQINLLHVASFSTPCGMLLRVVGSCCVRLHVAKRFTGFKLCATTRNNTQQHATGPLWKRTQHVTCHNVGSSWRTMLCPVPWGLKQPYPCDTASIVLSDL